MTTIFPFDELPAAPLVTGAIYEGGTAGTVADDPIAKLGLGVGNSGGIRMAGPIEAPTLVVLYSTGNESEWQDEIDPMSGTVVYHGDNRTPGKDLLDTSRHGNQLLHGLAEQGFRDLQRSGRLPPFLVFTKADGDHPSRSVIFHGVAEPGAPGLGESDWLVAKWFRTSSGRFLNYVLTLTLKPKAGVDLSYVRI